MFPQNTVVVERWWKVPLSKVGSPPRLHPRRHRVYKFVEDTKNAPKKDMELILTQTVPSEYPQWIKHVSIECRVNVWRNNESRINTCCSLGFILTELGGRGDTVYVKKSVGRYKLLPQGLAVYPSPENKEMFAEELRVCTDLSCLHSPPHVTSDCSVYLFISYTLLLLQLLREGRPEDRIQTRTGQMVSVGPHKYYVYYIKTVISASLCGLFFLYFKQTFPIFLFCFVFFTDAGFPQTIQVEDPPDALWRLPAHQGSRLQTVCQEGLPYFPFCLHDIFKTLRNVLFVI